MHLRLGPLVIVTETWLDELTAKVRNIKSSGGRLIKDNEQLEAVVRRQHDLLVDAEFKRNVAEARLNEACGLLAEQQFAIDHLKAVLRHPVTKPFDGDQP